MAMHKLTKVIGKALTDAVQALTDAIQALTDAD